jgi:hypothetical protein
LGGFGEGLGRGGLVQLDRRAVHAVEAGHRLPGSDQVGQWVGRIAADAGLGTGGRLHLVTLRVVIGAAGTIPPMETEVSADDAQGTSEGGPDDSALVTGPPAGPQPSSPDTAVDEVDRVLDQVELALARLDDGTYGLCATCGSAIDDAHLADNPMAQHCRECGTNAGAAHRL